MSKDKVHNVDAAYREISRKSFMHFVRGLTIPSATGPRVFELVMADFQREFFEAVAPSLHAVRDGTMPPSRRFWLERTKKTSKDNDVAACLLWVIAFSTRPILGQICAANADQASIIEDRALSILHFNPWLRDHVEVIQRCMRSISMPKEIQVRIEATTSGGSAQGPTPDILVLNELVHVDKWAVMKAHMNNASGVPQGIVIVATNAGIKGTPAEVWRKNAIANPKRWRTHIVSTIAPWVSQEDVEDARRLDPVGMEFARLWKGRWVSGVGDAISDDVIDRAFSLPGPLASPEPGVRYAAGLDLGISHDHAGIGIVGANERQNIAKVARIKGYAPSLPNDKGVLEVDCDQVEEDCYEFFRQFRIEWFGYDPAAGGSFMAQRLRKRGVPMREMTFASAINQTKMAVSFVTLMKDGKLLCYEDAEGRLRRDFGKFNIEHKPPSKYKLVAISDEYGHADVGVALVICLPTIAEMLGGWIGLQRDDVLVDDGGDLTDEEVAEMPSDLRDIYDMAQEEDEEWIRRNRPKISELDDF